MRGRPFDRQRLEAERSCAETPNEIKDIDFILAYKNGILLGTESAGPEYRAAWNRQNSRRHYRRVKASETPKPRRTALSPGDLVRLPDGSEATVLRLEDRNNFEFARAEGDTGHCPIRLAKRMARTDPLIDRLTRALWAAMDHELTEEELRTVITAALGR